MSKFSEYSLAQMTLLRGQITEVSRDAVNFQSAVKLSLDRIYQEFEESLVLARCFASVPLGTLPSVERAFAEQQAASRGTAAELTEDTLVLTLVGSRGQHPSWNNPRLSKQHLALPLTSASFIKTIPLVARMAGDMFKDVPWLAKQKTRIITKHRRHAEDTYVGRPILMIEQHVV